jgi:hypothetical protein
MLPRMRRRVVLAVTCLAVAGGLAVTASSCIGAVGIGDSCSSSSDCEQPSAQPPGLTVSAVCALGRCHYECGSTSFCGIGSECVEVGAAYVCTLPDEGTCTSSCPGALECGPDRLCHTACPAGACLMSQTCVAGLCIDDVVSDAGPETGSRDAAVEAPAADTSVPPDTSAPRDTGSPESASPPDTGTEGGHPDANPVDSAGGKDGPDE